MTMPPQTAAKRLSVYDTEGVDQVRRELRFDPGLLHKFRIALFKKASDPSEALLQLPEEVRSAFADRVAMQTLRLDRRFDSSVDGATKLLLKTEAGFAIESVILRAGTGRVALCLSSQVGCAAACDFCATGRMGIAQNLTAEEILDQVAQANRLLQGEDRKVRNLVFMGMGEPLHNEENLHRTIDQLVASHGFHHPPSRILVSTVGIPDAMLRLVERFPSVNLALSLHSPDQVKREAIIPLAKRYPIDELRHTVQAINHLQPAKKEVMIEHLMLQGRNDSTEDALLLAEWVKGLQVHVNLIPYNRVEEAPHLVGSSRQQIEAFGNLLKQRGIPTTIRYSMGRDIDAACGQLVRQENRAHGAKLASGRRVD